jgi:hypothetical protein
MTKRSRLANHPKTGQIGPVLGWSIGLIQRKLNRSSLDRFDMNKIFFMTLICKTV